MTKFAKAVGAWIAALALASCGGGSGSGGDGGFTGPGLRVSITPSQTQTTPYSLVDVPVRVTTANGTPVTDGTRVTVQVSSSSIGSVSSLQAVSQTPIFGERVTATTSGGTALFRFHSRAIGTVTLTATASDTSAGSAQVSASANISVVAGPPSDPRLTLVAQTTTLPINRYNVKPFFGSPYLSEISVTWRRLNGDLVTIVPPGQEKLTVGVSVNPVNSVGAFSTLDDPTTEDDPNTPEVENNEFQTLIAQGPVNVVSGKATIFFHSLDEAGTSTMTVTAQDPDTNETLQAELVFNVVTNTPPLPASISLQRDGRAVYASNSGGNNVDQFQAFVYDGSGDNVPDPGTPSAPVNNVEVEIIGGAQGGERLRAINAQGANVSGASLRTRTTQGIARFSYESGTRLGTLQIKVIADRADNNVDNGISDPVSATSNVVVGDGRLFDLDITLPSQDSVSEIFFSDNAGNTSTGAYYFNVSALATDRYGNPVIPGTEIRFGVIDGPQLGGVFAIAGNDGDPQEGGTTFSAPTGAFTTAGGGAGPDDTLIVFGEESNGNRDLESARRIASIVSPSSLTVTQRFNHNDDTGGPVNNGPVLPYVIGRAEDINVTTSAFTDQFGVAVARMAYPANKIGKLAVLYAQGDGDIVNGAPELVTDAEYVRTPGIAPGTLVASPDPIAGNTTSEVVVCLRDAAGQGVANALINFSFNNLFGTGSVDGTPNQGQLAHLTGPDGCVTATVVTAGLPQSSSNQATLTFSFGSLEDTINIRVNNNWYLYAFPSSTVGDGARLFTLRLVDSTGARVPGVLIVGECNATSPQSLTITTYPGVTNSQGETTTIVDGLGFDLPGGGSGTGTCTFHTINNEASVQIQWGTRDICDLFSPTPPVGCPSAQLTVQLTTTGLVYSTAPTSAMQCVGPGSCVASFQPLDTVTLSASANATWGGACAACGSGTPTCTVALGGNATNTVCIVSIP